MMTLLETYQSVLSLPGSQESGKLMFALPTLPRKDLITIPAGTIVPDNSSSVAKISCDIFVNVDWTNDGVLITSVLLNEEGYGRTYEEAWDDFLISLRDKLDVLAKREPRLDQADREILRALRDSLIVAP